jgi:hypothetical protein
MLKKTVERLRFDQKKHSKGSWWWRQWEKKDGNDLNKKCDFKL